MNLYLRLVLSSHSTRVPECFSRHLQYLLWDKLILPRQVPYICRHSLFKFVFLITCSWCSRIWFTSKQIESRPLQRQALPAHTESTNGFPGYVTELLFVYNLWLSVFLKGGNWQDRWVVKQLKTGHVGLTHDHFVYILWSKLWMH